MISTEVKGCWSGVAARVPAMGIFRTIKTAAPAAGLFSFIDFLGSNGMGDFLFLAIVRECGHPKKSPA
jgi:hypothetical protein